jgi:magnesium transporter
MRRPQGMQLPGRRPTGRFARVSEAEARLSRMSVRSQRVSALTDRLEEALVFIIHQDGRREYETMTLRQLYNYVLKAIATRPGGMAQSTRNLSGLRATVVPPSTEPPVLEVAEERPRSSFVSALTSSDKSDNDSSSSNDDESPTETADNAEDANEAPERTKTVTFDAPDNSRKRRSIKATKSICNTETITYRERLGGYLHPRDMRRLVTPFSTTNAPELMVRRHVILLNCDPLRAIVLRDRLLVLVPDGADSILEMIGKRILGGREEMEDSVFGTRHGEPSMISDSLHKSSSDHRTAGIQMKFTGWTGRGKGKDTKRTDSEVSDATVDEAGDESDEETVVDEWDDLEGRAWIDLPFELKAVDAVLHTVSVMLAKDVDTLQEAVYDTVDEVVVKGRASIGDHNQQLLRAFKNEIKEMSSRVDNFVRAINESLDDLEDLSLMNLSRLLTHPELFIQPVPEEVLNEESDEPELILEVYLQQALSICNQLDLLNGQVTTSEELMAMQLDTVRNRLLYVNAAVSIFTLTVSIAALIGSIYGMNVINGREEEPGAFNSIVIGTSVGCFVFLCSLLFVFYKALSLPNISM